MSRRRAMRTSDDVIVAVTPERVMATIRDGSSWSSWQPEILRSEGPGHLGAGDAVTGEARMMGFGVDGRATISSVDDASMAEDVIVGVRMSIRFDVEAGGAGTRITHTLESNLPSGLWGSVVAFFLKKRLVKMQRTALVRLKAQLEEPSP